MKRAIFIMALVLVLPRASLAQQSGPASEIRDLRNRLEMLERKMAEEEAERKRQAEEQERKTKTLAEELEKKRLEEYIPSLAEVKPKYGLGPAASKVYSVTRGLSLGGYGEVQGLLEISHFHLFSMGILMLTLTHLLLFVPLPPKQKALFICLSFGSAFLDGASSWLIRFVHPWFAFLKIASFAALQLTLLVLMACVFFALWKQSPSAYTQDLENLK